MARVPTGRQRQRARWLTGALVAVLAVAAIVLSVLAVVRTQNAADSVATTPRPVPSFTVSPTAQPSSTPSPSAPTPSSTAAVPGAAERFLSVGEGAAWRATAGECGGAGPLLERSTDGGATWQDVTPRYRGIGQILSLDAFAGTEAELVALMGPGCELQALRTFTQGRFWEPYPDVLAASTYVDPARPATVMIAGSETEAPCSAPWGVRAASGTIGVICEGIAYRLVDGEWQPVADGALAITADAAGITAAGTAPDCPGLQLTPPDPAAAACAAEVPASPPLALYGTLVWVEDRLVSVTD